MRRTTKISLAAIVLAGLVGCAGTRDGGGARPAKKDYTRPLPDGASALRKVSDPARIPNLAAAFPENPNDLLTALQRSMRYFASDWSRGHYPMAGITHDRAVASLVAFRQVLTTAATPEEFEKLILERFDVYESVGCDGLGTVLFTGYYTPIFDASLTPDATYKWPLYKRPPDLVTDENGKVLGRRASDGSLIPEYYSRREIDGGALKGLELVYLRDRFEAYICGVQGSAHLRLPDGTNLRVGYAGTNGRPYTSVGRLLIEDSLMPRDRLSLASLIVFFRAHSEIMDAYLPRNARYTFFQVTDLPPTGSLNVPVTAYRSVATDKNIFPRGCLTLVDTQLPYKVVAGRLVARPFRQFMLDQDAGGAIRAPGRADVYLGVGETAGNVAGWMYREGKLYYLFLKE